MTKQQFIKRLNKLTNEIAKKRDELRELIDDAEAHLDSNERAHQALQEAADALSELV